MRSTHEGLGIRVLAGSEVDILKEGALDYSDEILAQLDVVVCSIHSYMNLDRVAMTDRMLAAIENPYTPDHRPPDGPPSAASAIPSITTWKRYSPPAPNMALPWSAIPTPSGWTCARFT